MLELLFLLLPIAAGYGWYMGRRSVRQDTQKQSNQFSRQYVAGLNYLLSDESDKAVDLFIQLLEVDSETIETHLSLGNLFRQRGEVDRAIKIHQNLVARQLTREQRQLALQELARDFLAAGLLDRAEAIWKELCEDSDFEETALAQLLIIHQQLREWDKAIEVAVRLQQFQGKKLAEPISHFYCEQAENALREGNQGEALAKFKRALGINPACARASLRLAELAMAEGEYERASKELLRVFEQDMDFASEAIPKLLQCYQQQGRSQALIPILEKAVEEHAGVSVTLTLAKLVEERDGLSQARELVLRQLRRHPSMKGFYQLVGFQLASAEEGPAKESLELLQQLVGEQIKIKSTHKCRQCGFATHSLFWQCPSCRQWGSIKPIRGLDGE
ncbi:lipopolysaccharide assembly protein LapB [Aeromonas enteropelogenes]|uniref:lipopolysaccharide assembly protein LapB n=1 Tax=Aeromonas enteropelogenes TaxID=29489 RepID=UPI0022869953|nr:lipopolysaccharide assembly protein LapB [Aeromonas enteropelogenes]MCZ0750561.1 lipopolysaccharide assembly protein LapB [Aeromonas enteropelogenes]